MDNLSIIGSIVSIGIGSGFLIRAITILSKIRIAAKELVDLIQLLRNRIQDPELKKEADEATEAVADILDEINLKGWAIALRNIF